MGCKQKYQYTIENKLFDCLIDSYQSQGVDLVYEMQLLENHLIEINYFEDSTGESYFNFWKQLSLDSDYEIMVKEEKFLQLGIVEINSSLARINDECLKNEKQMDIYNSKVNVLQSEFVKLDVENVELDQFAQCYINVLTPDDFENQYFKGITLIYISTVCEVEMRHKEYLPKKEKSIN